MVTPVITSHIGSILNIRWHVEHIYMENKNVIAQAEKCKTRRLGTNLGSTFLSLPRPGSTQPYTSILLIQP